MGRPAWLLALSCHASIGVFFAYETAGALAPQFEEAFGITTAQIGVIYSGWSMPGVLTILIWGMVNARLGEAKTLCLTSSIAALGTVIMALSSSFWPMFIGSIIFGAGGGACYNIGSTLIGKWFVGDKHFGKKVSISHGLSKTWLRGGSFAAFALLPFLADKFSLRFSMWFSAWVSISGAVAAVIFLILVNTVYKEPTDVGFVPLESISQKEENKASAFSISASADDETADKARLVIREIEEIDTSYNNTNNSINNENNVKLKIVNLWKSFVSYWAPFKTCPTSYWIMYALVIVMVTDLYAFTAFLTKIVHDDFGYSEENAAFATSIVCLANLVTASLTSFVFGFFGKRTYGIFVGSIFLFFTHISFAFTTKIPPYLLAGLLGLSQSILDTNLWPSLPLVLAPNLLGMAYTINQISYNAFFVFFTASIGFVRDVSDGWFNVQLIFSGFSFCSVVLAISLWYVNRRDDGPLEMTDKEMNERKELREKSQAVGGDD